MCDKTIEKDSMMLKFVPDYFKTQEMCEKAFTNVFSIIYVIKNTLKNSQMVLFKDYYKITTNYYYS